MKEAQCKRAEEDFYTRRISMMDLSETVLEQVHMFPFPVQELIIGEAREMSARIQKGKAPPELTTPECNCLFFSRCLLPCRHNLHAHIFGADPPEKLMSIEDWRKEVQHMIDERGLEVYRSRETIEVHVRAETEEERQRTMYKRTASALLENVRNGIWRAMEHGDETFIEQFIVDPSQFSLSHSE